MQTEDLRQPLAQKTGREPDMLWLAEVEHSTELAEVIEQDWLRYSEPNACYSNAAHMTLDGNMEEELEYVLVYAIRLHGREVIDAAKHHTDVQAHIIPLTDDIYAFGHAIVYNFSDEEFYDPTLQDTKHGFADHYFVAQRFEYDELHEYLKDHDHMPPQLLNESAQ